jgi:hypothetical protein
VARSVRFPVEPIPPEGFDPARLETWPRREGRLEWVGGRLPWMPPCGEAQQVTVADVVVALGRWAESHPEFPGNPELPGLEPEVATLFRQASLGEAG